MPEVLRSSASHSPFFTIGRLFGAVVLYVLLGMIPPSPFEKPLYLLRLTSAPAPDHVAVPVDGVLARNLRDSWGNPRGGGRRHEGIDIFAPRGTRVVASTEGVVWRIGTDPLGGRVVWIFAAGRQMHYYAHLDRYATIREGERVAVGDTLGYVGTSGNASGGAPHLHYGIYVSGRGAIDPYLLLTSPAP